VKAIICDAKNVVFCMLNCNKNFYKIFFFLKWSVCSVFPKSCRTQTYPLSAKKSKEVQSESDFMPLLPLITFQFHPLVVSLLERVFMLSILNIRLLKG